MADTLKPCPFCGHEVTLYDRAGRPDVVERARNPYSLETNAHRHWEQGYRAALETTNLLGMREALEAIFHEHLGRQASRLGINPDPIQSPGQWRDCVRKAAIIKALGAQ
jgi:hypothetical protein